MTEDEIDYHILAEKRTCAGQHRQNLLNKCPNMKKEHLSSLGPFFFLFLLPFFTCTVQPTCSRIKCMVLISCVHGINFVTFLQKSTDAFCISENFKYFQHVCVNRQTLFTTKHLYFYKTNVNFFTLFQNVNLKNVNQRAFFLLGRFLQSGAFFTIGWANFAIGRFLQSQLQNSPTKL